MRKLNTRPNDILCCKYQTSFSLNEILTLKRMFEKKRY